MLISHQNGIAFLTSVFATKWVIVPLLVIGCEGGPRGTLVVQVSGGNEAREGIPRERFRDGYAVRYRHVVLELEGFFLASRDGERARIEVEPVVVELVPQPAQAFRIEGVPARRWDLVGFSSRPVPPNARLAQGVDQSIVERMRREGWSLYLEGTLIGRTPPRGEPGEIEFEFGIPVAVDYTECSSGDGTLGIVVVANTITQGEITWHLTHTWFDSFVENASLRGEAYAAAWPGRGPLLAEHLRTQLLSRLRGVDGGPLLDEEGNPIQYLPGMTGARTLREFLFSHRYAHWNGLDGECKSEIRILAP
ncbi:MAG: hypothetical protein RMJ84_08560 [Sandaracinaceae bacterium]|nr:hypothetical protein [Sandaracinaceae bacterium]